MVLDWNETTHHPSRETRFLRDSIIDGFRIAGGLYICRQKHTLQEYNDNLVEHCPLCWDDVLKQSNNSRCPQCWGSGYADGGYKPPFVVRAHLGENTRTYEEKHETAGVHEVEDMVMKLPFEPLFRSGDVFAEIIEMEEGVPTLLGRKFQIAGEVTRKTVQGIVDNNRINLTMDLRERIVSQEANVKLLLETDDKNLLSDSFWGVSTSRNPDMLDYEVQDIDFVLFGNIRRAHAWALPEVEQGSTT